MRFAETDLMSVQVLADAVVLLRRIYIVSKYMEVGSMVNEPWFDDEE